MYQVIVNGEVIKEYESQRSAKNYAKGLEGAVVTECTTEIATEPVPDPVEELKCPYEHTITEAAVIQAQAGPGPVVMNVGPGAKIRVVSDRGEWHEVEALGKRGYIHFK